MLGLLGKEKIDTFAMSTLCVTSIFFTLLLHLQKGGALPNLPKLLVSVSITWFDCFFSNDQSHVIVITVMDAVYHFKYYTAVTGNPKLNTYTFHS